MVLECNITEQLLAGSIQLDVLIQHGHLLLLLLYITSAYNNDKLVMIVIVKIKEIARQGGGVGAWGRGGGKEGGGRKRDLC